MLEPRLIAWYQARQACIDALTLTQYLEELAQLVLEKNWVHKIRDTIISSKQGSHTFIDWKIEIENLNAILTTSSPTHALTEDGLKIQLEANLNFELKTNLLNEPTLSNKLDAWSTEVKERNDRVKVVLQGLVLRTAKDRRLDRTRTGPRRTAVLVFLFW